MPGCSLYLQAQIISCIAGLQCAAAKVLLHFHAVGCWQQSNLSVPLRIKPVCSSSMVLPWLLFVLIHSVRHTHTTPTHSGASKAAECNSAKCICIWHGCNNATDVHTDQSWLIGDLGILKA